MNAAARLVHQRSVSKHLILTYSFTIRQLAALLLSFGVIISLLGIIYVTHASRIQYANYERQLAEYNRLQVERSQLLLERSTYMVPARVQKIAESTLGMAIPDQESIVIIQE